MTFVSPPTDCFQISLSLDKNLMRYMQSETTQLFIMNNLLNQCLGTLSFQMLQHNVIDGTSQSSTLKIPQSESEDCMTNSISINTVENGEHLNNSRKRPRKSLPTSYIPSKLPSISELHGNKSDIFADSTPNDSLLLPGVKEEITEDNYPPDAEEDGSDDIVCVKEEILDCRNVEKTEPSPYETLEIPGLFTKVLPRKYDNDSNPRMKNNRALEKQPMQNNSTHELDLRPIGGFDSSLRSEFTLGDAVPASSGNSDDSGGRNTTVVRIKQVQGHQVTACSSSSQSSAATCAEDDQSSSCSSSSSYFCPICEQQFSSYGSARRHVAALHGNVRYACQICSKIFNRKDILKQHLQHNHQLSGDVAAAMIKCPSSSFKVVNS